MKVPIRSIFRSTAQTPLVLRVKLLVPGESSVADAVRSLFAIGALKSLESDYGDAYPIESVEVIEAEPPQSGWIAHAFDPIPDDELRRCKVCGRQRGLHSENDRCPYRGPRNDHACDRYVHRDPFHENAFEKWTTE